tara:strand:+ start:11497 stop:12114 length:618 start_codon:yes stop_codon:yes gene_type:complete
MAVIDTITIGGDSFSVYALTASGAVSETSTFWNGRLGAEAAAWAAAVTAAADDEKRALAAAADWLDRASLFTGSKTVATQARAWPRDGAADGCAGLDVTDGSTPDEIFYAQAWLAGAILVDTAAAASSGEGANIKSAKAGSAQVVFFRPTEGTASDTRLPQVADDYVKCFTSAGTSSGIAGPTITGTSATSSATACDDELTEGFA